jgi:hypothetical protein
MQIKHNMHFQKYKYFYINGTSHSEGGGLEEPEIRSTSVRAMYEKKYGITWKNRSEINFGKRLSDIIGIPCINEAKCGSSLNRIIRTTYDFIYKNWDDRHDFFIILEKPDPSRAEVYDNESNQYFIINSIHKPNIKSEFEFLYATREYWSDITKDEDERNQFKFEKWYNNHFCYDENFNENEKSLIGLYSFCKQNGIKIILMEENFHYFKECFLSEDIIDIGDISTYCEDNKMTITHELSDINYIDGHPGYFGHIEYAKLLARFLGWDGEFKINLTKKNLI